MSEFKVGDKVKLSEIGEKNYSNCGLNPRDTEGSVIEVIEVSGYPVEVRWDNRVKNVYKEGELDLVEETSGLTKVGKTFQGYKENGDLHYPSPEEEEEFKRIEANLTEEYTGGSSSYYDVRINGTEIRCLDIIEALNMNYAEGNAFKAVWRIAASKQGRQKKGNTRLYDAEKVIFFGERLVEEHSG